jgi:hypothetical protein
MKYTIKFYGSENSIAGVSAKIECGGKVWNVPKRVCGGAYCTYDTIAQARKAAQRHLPRVLADIEAETPAGKIKQLISIGYTREQAENSVKAGE